MTHTIFSIRRILWPLVVGLAVPVSLLAQGPLGEEEEGHCEEECSPPTPMAFEVISADCSNIRGMNFIANYASLMSYNPADPAQSSARILGPTIAGSPLPWRGVVSPTAMWWAYDKIPNSAPGQLIHGIRPESDVWDGLERMQQIGVNTVRVWLSFPLWRHYEYDGLAGNQYIDNFADFVAKAKVHYIYVIPVLWDMFGTNSPVYEGPNYFDLSDSYDPAEMPPELLPQLFTAWHNSPGDGVVKSFLGSFTDDPATLGLPPALYVDFENYIRDTVQAVLPDKDAILMWDLMNEPQVGVGYEAVRDFILESDRVVKEEDPTAWTLVGFASVGDIPTTGDYGFLDVVGTQTYSVSRMRLEGLVAGHDDVAAPGPPESRQPLIAVESNGADFLAEAVDYHSNVPRFDLGFDPADPDDPDNPRGMGFVVFNAYDGLRGTNYVYPNTGLFYGDHKVVEGRMRGIQALRDLAVTRDGQGWVAGLPLPPQADQISAFGGFRHPYLSRGDGFGQIEKAMTTDFLAWPSDSYSGASIPPGLIRSPSVNQWKGTAEGYEPTDEMLHTAYQFMSLAKAYWDLGKLDLQKTGPGIEDDELYRSSLYPNNRLSKILIQQDDGVTDAMLGDLSKHYADESPLAFTQLKNRLQVLRERYSIRFLKRKFKDDGVTEILKVLETGPYLRDPADSPFADTSPPLMISPPDPGGN